jgi:hypothetical protein
LVVRILVAVVGVGLIVQDVREHLKIGTHDLRITSFRRTALLYDEQRGIFNGRTGDGQRVSIVLEVFNQVKARRVSKSTGKIKAQLRLESDASDTELIASPAAWVGEYFSSVEIGPGDTRELIIAVSFDHTSDWRMVVNRRGDAGEAVSISFGDIIWTTKGRFIVDFISCASGKVIQEFELGWKWEDGLSPQILYFKPRS